MATAPSPAPDSALPVADDENPSSVLMGSEKATAQAPTLAKTGSGGGLLSLDTQETTMLWIVSSVLSSTFLILIIKMIMRNYGFTFVYSLTALHFFAGAVAMRVASGVLGTFTPKSIGWKQNVIVSAAAVGSVASMNLSLQYNSVGTYQMLKLLIIPGCMFMQYLMTGTKSSYPVLLSLLVMLGGVAAATVTDISFSSLGVSVGLVSVATTTLFAVWQGSKQKEHSVDAQQLLNSISPYQTVWALVLGLLFDVPGSKNVLSHEYDTGEVVLILISALIAVAVNVSSMQLIGRTSPVSYQVVGHAKTCLILISGYLFVPESGHMGWELIKNVAGVSVGLLGVFSYSYFKVKLGN